MLGVQKGRTAPFVSVLRETLGRAARTTCGERSALYVVGLTDPNGFALALAIFAKSPGADPAVLRERPRRQGIREPLVPVLIATEGVAIASSLETFMAPEGENQINGRARPAVGEA